MKLENINKATNIIHSIKEYERFLEIKCKSWDKLSITKKETNYILRTAYGIFVKEIKVDETMSNLITEVIQKRIEMLKQELVELGIEMKESKDE